MNPMTGTVEPRSFMRISQYFNISFILGALVGSNRSNFR